MESAASKAQRLFDEGRAAIEAHDASRGLELLNKAVYLQPDDPMLLAMRAEAHIRLCDFQSAMVNLRRALKLTKAAAEGSVARAREDGLDPGAANAAKAHTASFKAQGIAIATRLAHVIDLRAVSLIEDGLHTEAAPLLTEAIGHDGSLRRLYLHRALAYTALERYEEALIDLSKCIDMDERDADVFFLRAKLSLLAGDLPGARRAADRALKLNPDHPEASELGVTMGECADVYRQEATKLMLLGSPADAIANLTHAMSLQPDDPHLLMRRGAARRQQGQLYEVRTARRRRPARWHAARRRHAEGQPATHPAHALAPRRLPATSRPPSASREGATRSARGSWC